jgi:hypothetical protein
MFKTITLQYVFTIFIRDYIAYLTKGDVFIRIIIVITIIDYGIYRIYLSNTR